MKTKLIILLILFSMPFIAAGAGFEFTSEEKQIAHLCGKSGPTGVILHPEGPKTSLEYRGLAILSTKINEANPGSTINCNTGSGVLAIDAQKYYFNDWKVIRMTMIGDNSLDYEVSEYGRYWKVSDGRNFIKLEPMKELFIDVNLPVIAETATVTGKKQFVGFRNNELMKLLNEFYAANKEFGDIYGFSNLLLLDTSFRETFVTWAEKYLQKSNPPQTHTQKTIKKNSDTKKSVALQKAKWEVSPEETSKCILELREVMKKSKTDIEIERFQKTPCGRVLKISEKYLDKEAEFTSRVDEILKKEEK